MNYHHRDRLVSTIRGLAVLAAGVLLTTGCITERQVTTSATTETSTPSLSYAAPGKHAAGYRVFTTTGAQEQRLMLRAWYPARRPDNQQPTTIDYTAPNKFGEEITPGKEINTVGTALADGRPEPSGGPYPLVVFSHGYALSPIVYSTLVEHYASQGYIVLAPEHNETFDQELTDFGSALLNRPVDITRTIDYAEQLNQPGEPLAGMIDMDNMWGAKLTYDHAGSENKTLITFPGAGHFLFVDPCENLRWVEKSVYRDAICTDPVWSERPLDIVTHYTTAFLRDTLNGDPEARATLAGQQPDLDNVEYVTTNQP